jgi:hypothetical protein
MNISQSGSSAEAGRLKNRAMLRQIVDEESLPFRACQTSQRVQWSLRGQHRHRDWSSSGGTAVVLMLSAIEPQMDTDDEHRKVNLIMFYYCTSYKMLHGATTNREACDFKSG